MRVTLNAVNEKLAALGTKAKGAGYFLSAVATPMAGSTAQYG